MITPAYSLAATERVLPRMVLDFTTGVLDPRVTIARALNTATRVNSSGLVEIVNADLPRFDYDPETLAPRGLLIEESRANAIVYSQDFSNVLWVATASAKTSTNNPDPAGTNTALLITANGASTAHHLIGGTAILYTSGTTYTASAYIKAGSTSFAQITLPTSTFGAGQYANFQLTGSGSVTASAGGTASILAAGNDWYRVSFSVAATATAATAGFFLVFIANGTAGRLSANTSTDTLYFWGAQIETGAFATSYIPTVASQVTRNPDVVTMTGTNFSDWYNASEGTFVANLQAVNGRLLSANDGTGSNRLLAVNRASATLFSASITDATVSQASLTSTVADTSVVSLVSLAYKADSFAFCVNGGIVQTDNVGTVPTVNQLQIGRETTFAGTCWFRQIRYYPQRLINAEVQAFTKG